MSTHLLRLGLEVMGFSAVHTLTKTGRRDWNDGWDRDQLAYFLTKTHVTSVEVLSLVYGFKFPLAFFGAHHDCWRLSLGSLGSLCGHGERLALQLLL